MTLPRRAVCLTAMLLLAGCASAPLDATQLASRTAAARSAETAFAQTMADRDFKAFASHIADDAVFINGGQPLRGKAAVLLFWQRFFERADAPFSWKPEIVEVAASGDLAYTEGPVARPDGAVFARFFSTWRLEPDGRWRVVFDNGYNLNTAAKPAAGGN
jgi:ketosteroid isomerase-like protein